MGRGPASIEGNRIDRDRDRTDKDKDGRPVTYNLYSEAKGPKNAEVFGDVKRFIRWRVQLMERGIELLDFENIGDMVQVHGTFLFFLPSLGCVWGPSRRTTVDAIHLSKN